MITFETKILKIDRGGQPCFVNLHYTGKTIQFETTKAHKKMQ